MVAISNLDFQITEQSKSKDCTMTETIERVVGKYERVKENSSCKKI